MTTLLKLMGRGGVDRQVPPEHWRQFTQAAKQAGVPIEAVFYPEEGHGFFHDNNERDFLLRTEKLLATTLQPR